MELVILKVIVWPKEELLMEIALQDLEFVVHFCTFQFLTAREQRADRLKCCSCKYNNVYLTFTNVAIGNFGQYFSIIFDRELRILGPYCYCFLLQSV